jgi:predicted nucleotidyltransferase
MSAKIDAIKRQVVPVLKEAGVLRSSVFGSVARGDGNDASDVDLLVELPQGKSLFDLADLQTRLERAVGKKVDVGTYASIKPVLKDSILRKKPQG